MGAGANVGRVGGLAVALGIGAAVTFGCGTAAADSGESSQGASPSSQSASASSSSAAKPADGRKVSGTKKRSGASATVSSPSSSESTAATPGKHRKRATASAAATDAPQDSKTQPSAAQPSGSDASDTGVVVKVASVVVTKKSSSTGSPARVPAPAPAELLMLGASRRLGAEQPVAKKQATTVATALASATTAKVSAQAVTATAAAATATPAPTDPFATLKKVAPYLKYVKAAVTVAQTVVKNALTYVNTTTVNLGSAGVVIVGALQTLDSKLSTAADTVNILVQIADLLGY